MKTTLRLTPHRVNDDGQALEILLGNELLGVLYPTADGVKLITRHTVLVTREPTTVLLPEIQSFGISIRAHPSPSVVTTAT